MRVIFAGGATGGHLYPALAVAKKLKEKYPDMQALFITYKWELSTEIIENNGYKVKHIDVAGIDRTHLLSNISFFKKLAASSKQIKNILNDFKPDFVVGTGGNISGSVVRIAHKMGIPTFLHEQNVLPGLSNKLAERYVDKIFIAFEESKIHFMKEKKLVVSGNPVREEFTENSETDFRKDLVGDFEGLVLLIFGGSQGADKINEVATDYLISIKGRNDIEVFFITGHEMYEPTMQKLSEAGVPANKRIHILNYVENIHELYAASDIIVSRAGALSISEIAVMGKPSILIPSPNVSGNHQLFNAKTLTEKKAAVLLEEKDFTAESLDEAVNKLWSNKESLKEMSIAATELGRPDAVDIIVDGIIEYIKDIKERK